MSESNTDSIAIKDSSPAAFRALLQHLLTDTPPTDVHTTFDVMLAPPRKHQLLRLEGALQHLAGEGGVEAEQTEANWPHLVPRVSKGVFLRTWG